MFKKIKYFGLAICLMISTIGIFPKVASAENCPDLHIIFARGSGSELNTESNFLSFKSTIETKLQTTSLTYDFIDLPYDAVGIENLSVSLGALFSGGEAYDFGDSVNGGVNQLIKLVNNSTCRSTKYILGGYSQGAIVISKSLPSLNSEKIIYAATFGDPKLYLPEGEGLMPAACKNENLSDYRAYVPDCHAYEGLLGGYQPYEPTSFQGKLGTWCNKKDIFCSSYLNISDHLSYVSDAIYEDASRVIFSKITDYFGIDNSVSSPHDTAILIDSTGSMSGMIDSYKQEALRLAEETFTSNGRVALYEYRDLADPFLPVEHCGFETCTLEIVKSELDTIIASGGGDTPESLLSASFQVMSEQTWKYGSTKSLVILTDANFLSPDRDGMTFDEVVHLSKTIDPVNFYIITNSKYAATYESLAAATDGKVVSSLGEVSFLTDYIIERYDSLPRVEESEIEIMRPELTIASAVQSSENSMTFSLKTTAEKVIVTLNDQILGLTDQTDFTISDLDFSQINSFQFTPVTDVRGTSAIYTMSPKTTPEGFGQADSILTSAPTATTQVPIKAPNTGVL